jgi:plastocyanin
MIGVMKPLQAVVAFVAWSAAAFALAGQIQVSVTGPDGKPAADVAVLISPSSEWKSPPAPGPATIVQQGTRFVPYLTIVPVGGSARFVNRDRYDHHLRSQAGGPLGTIAPAKEFEFRMAASTGTDVLSPELRFDQPGVVTLGCHIHGSMRGHVLVSSSPWYAVTDAAGKAVVDNLPEGQAEMKLWHPDQLIDQPPVRVQVGAASPIEGKLNFTPRVRPAPRSGTTASGPTSNYR